MRGMFTSGILDVLMENGIYFDKVVGVSAGAAFGCNYKAHQPGRAVRYNKRYCRDPRFVSVASLILTGSIYNYNFAYRRIPQKLDVFDFKTFAESPMEFYAVSTDVLTGKPYYARLVDGSEDDMRRICASASMPGVSRVVEVDGRKLLDGGTSDSIPLRFLETLGCDRRVVILTQPRGYVKSPTSMASFMWKRVKKYPELVKALENRHEMYNEELAYVAKREAEGEVLVIAPPEPLNIKSVCRDENELERVYQIGRGVGREKLDEIRNYIEN